MPNRTGRSISSDPPLLNMIVNAAESKTTDITISLISTVLYLAGGLFLLVMTLGGRHPILGLVLPVIALVIGSGALLSRNRDDKKPGLVFAAAGIAGLLVRFGIPLLRPFAAFALVLGAIGLIVAGIWKGINFLHGLKSRQ